MRAITVSFSSEEPYEDVCARLVIETEERHGVVIKCVMSHGPYKGRWLRASLAGAYARLYPPPQHTCVCDGSWDVDAAMEEQMEEAYECAALYHFLEAGKDRDVD